MLIRSGIFLNGMDVDSPLMGKRRIPDVGLPLIRQQVRNFRNEIGDVPELPYPIVSQHFRLHLQLKVGQHGTEIDVPASLSDPVDGPLHLPGALLNGHQGIRHRHFRVIMRMNAQGHATHLLHLRPNGLDFPRHGAAVGVTENNPFGPAVDCRLYRLHRIGGIGLKPVKEVFGIIKDLFPLRT